MTRQTSAHEKWHSVFHFQVDEPPEELRITHRMLDKLLKVTFSHSPLSGWLFSKSFPDVFQISIVWFRFCHINVLIFSRYREMSLGLTAFLLMTWWVSLENFHFSSDVLKTSKQWSNDMFIGWHWLNHSTGPWGSSAAWRRVRFYFGCFWLVYCLLIVLCLVKLIQSLKSAYAKTAPTFVFIAYDLNRICDSLST